MAERKNTPSGPKFILDNERPFRIRELGGVGWIRGTVAERVRACM